MMAGRSVHAAMETNFIRFCGILEKGQASKNLKKLALSVTCAPGNQSRKLNKEIAMYKDDELQTR